MLLRKQPHTQLWRETNLWHTPRGDLPRPHQKGKQIGAGGADRHTDRSLRDLCH